MIDISTGKGFHGIVLPILSGHFIRSAYSIFSSLRSTLNKMHAGCGEELK
jgi:hypothetical protein